MEKPYRQDTDLADFETVSSEADRAHLFSFTAGAWLPALQSIVTGLLVSALVWWGLWQFLHLVDAWRWALGVFLFIELIMWLVLMVRWLGLTVPLEKLLKIDLDRDGRIGDQPILRVQIDQETKFGKRHEWLQIPGTDIALRELRSGLLRGRPFTEREWSGPNRPYSIDEFREVRRQFEAHGIVETRSDKRNNVGYVVTDKGKEVLRGLFR